MTLSGPSRTVYAPVFEKDGQRFLFCGREWANEDHWTAMKAGWGTMFVECILTGSIFTNETIKFEVTDEDGMARFDQLVQRATLGDYPVVILGELP